MKKRTAGLAALGILLGKQPDEKSPTYNYQRRQSALVQSMSMLPALFWVALVAYAAKESMSIGVTIAFAVLYYKIHFAAASASDAVFDSLWERVNLQSQYFDVRLQSMDSKLDSIAGKGWPPGHYLLDETYPGNLVDAFSSYPERSWAERGDKFRATYQGPNDDG